MGDLCQYLPLIAGSVIWTSMADKKSTEQLKIRISAENQQLFLAWSCNGREISVECLPLIEFLKPLLPLRKKNGDNWGLF